jgi:biopolymer transport protein TolR
MGMIIGDAKKKGAGPPVMNITPLVDVVLVLLIIFMVMIPMLSKQLWLNLPKKDDSAKDEPKPAESNENVVLTVDKAGAFFVNKTEIPKDQLKERIQRMMNAKSDKIAPYSATIEAMDIAKLGGAKTLAILTQKPAK